MIDAVKQKTPEGRWGGDNSVAKMIAGLFGMVKAPVAAATYHPENKDTIAVNARCGAVSSELHPAAIKIDEQLTQIGQSVYVHRRESATAYNSPLDTCPADPIIAVTIGDRVDVHVHVRLTVPVVNNNSICHEDCSGMARTRAQDLEFSKPTVARTLTVNVSERCTVFLPVESSGEKRKRRTYPVRKPEKRPTWWLSSVCAQVHSGCYTLGFSSVSHSLEGSVSTGGMHGVVCSELVEVAMLLTMEMWCILDVPNALVTHSSKLCYMHHYTSLSQVRSSSSHILRRGGGETGGTANINPSDVLRESLSTGTTQKLWLPPHCLDAGRLQPLPLAQQIIALVPVNMGYSRVRADQNLCHWTTGISRLDPPIGPMMYENFSLRHPKPHDFGNAVLSPLRLTEPGVQRSDPENVVSEISENPINWGVPLLDPGGGELDSPNHRGQGRGQKRRIWYENHHMPKLFAMLVRRREPISSHSQYATYLRTSEMKDPSQFQIFHGMSVNSTRIHIVRFLRGGPMNGEGPRYLLSPTRSD
ncbi:hypothetical protein EV401DRAFT_2197136 [Pisolithus croceorrhizus]|nr:hypothetical protein EV401DRAFT_2197136 [Pisolithus croceorrhizus]